MIDNLTGYHGTSLENASSILTSRIFRISGNEKDWLGRGVYFFEKDRHQAYMFSKYRNKLEDKDVAVLCAEIRVERDKFIDLLLDEDRSFIEEYTHCLENKILALKDTIGDWQHKEGYVLDYLHKEQPYDVVRAAYEVPSRKMPFKDILSYLNVHIQICVKEPKCIITDSIKEVDCDAYRSI